MNIDPLTIMAGFAAGVAVGIVYFAALWRAVRQLPGRPRALHGLALGALLRMACILPVIYLGALAGIEALGGGLAGVLIARTVVVRRLNRAARPNATAG